MCCNVRCALYNNGIIDCGNNIFNRYSLLYCCNSRKRLPTYSPFDCGVYSRSFLDCQCPLNSSSPLNAADDLKGRVIEAYKDGDKIYINGNPVEDGFDLNGVNLDKYDIKLENDTVYLMSK